MAITLRNAGTVTNSTTVSSVAPAIPGSPVNATTVMILHFIAQADRVSTLVDPSGWTRIYAMANGTTMLAAWYRVFQTGDGSPSISWTTATSVSAVVDTYNGVHTSTPMDATGSATTFSTALPTTPSLTAITMGAARIACYAASTTGTLATPHGCVSRHQVSAAGAARRLGIFDQIGLASDASGGKTAGTANRIGVSGIIMLRPATPSIFGLLRSAEAYGSGGGATVAGLASGDVANAPTGTCIIVAANNTDDGTINIASVTYNSGSNALTKAIEQDDAFPLSRASLWYYANNTVTGALTFTATPSDGVSAAGLFVSEWKGVKLSSPVDKTGSAHATSSATVGQISTSSATAADTILSVANYSSDAAGATGTTDVDYVQRCQSIAGVAAPLQVSSRELTGGSVETTDDTLASGNSGWAGVLVTFLTEPPPATGQYMAPMGVW